MIGTTVTQVITSYKELIHKFLLFSCTFQPSQCSACVPSWIFMDCIIHDLYHTSAEDKWKACQLENRKDELWEWWWVQIPHSQLSLATFLMLLCYRLWSRYPKWIFTFSVSQNGSHSYFIVINSNKYAQINFLIGMCFSDCARNLCYYSKNNCCEIPQCSLLFHNSDF